MMPKSSYDMIIGSGSSVKVAHGLGPGSNFAFPPPRSCSPNPPKVLDCKVCRGTLGVLPRGGVGSTRWTRPFLCAAHFRRTPQRSLDWSGRSVSPRERWGYGDVRALPYRPLGGYFISLCFGVWDHTSGEIIGVRSYDHIMLQSVAILAQARLK